MHYLCLMPALSGQHFRLWNSTHTLITNYTFCNNLSPRCIPPQVWSWCRSCFFYKKSWESLARRSGWFLAYLCKSAGHWRRHRALFQSLLNPDADTGRHYLWVTLNVLMRLSFISNKMIMETADLSVMEVHPIHRQFLCILQKINFSLCWRHSPVCRITTSVTNIFIGNKSRLLLQLFF